MPRPNEAFDEQEKKNHHGYERAHPQAGESDGEGKKKNGFDVCDAVKNEMGLGHIHIILLTAKGQEFDRKRGQEVGADLYMTKPFDPDALIAKARSVLGLSTPGV